MLRRVGLALSALAAILLAVAWVISQNILHPKPRVEKHTLADFDLAPEPVTFYSRDGIRLAGWFLAAEGLERRHPLVVLSHGWARSHAELLPHADLLHRAGFSVLLFDYRHRGESAGDACTLGIREQADLLGALDAMEARADVDVNRIAVLGLSTGSVIAILAGAQDERIRAIVAESPFASHDVIMTRSLRRFYHLPRVPFGLAARWVIERRVGEPLEAGEAGRVIQRFSPRPIFVIADEQDEVLGPDEAGRLFELAAEPKRLWSIAGADHARGWQAAPEEYERRVVAFLNEALAPEAVSKEQAGAVP